VAAVHVNQLDDEDLAIMARTGVAAVVCPQVSLRLGSGIAPLARLAAHGIGVGLGSGDAAAAGALDLLAEARMAALGEGAHAGGGALDAARALELATLGGAAALGLDSQTGSLESGKSADLICIDLDTLACRSAPEAPLDAVVFAATRAQISDVWVAGQPAVAERRLLGFDAQELADLAARWRARLPAGIAA
jgi:5-methylthioadenosine/S-adenosylhomocysteine deaminase